MSSVGCAPSTINIYDSLHGRLDTHTRKIIADLIQSKQKHIEVHYHDVQWQSGPNDCGLFAIAFATSICFGNDPTKIIFKQEEMRHHLLFCIELKKLVTFPIKSKCRTPKPVRKEIIAIYCTCCLIADGTKMVECSSCLEWFHQSCVNVSEYLLTNRELD